MTPTELEVPTVEVGNDVMSLCSKCGDHWHVVVSHKDELIDKAECKGCGRPHKYKPQEQEVVDAIKAYKKAKKALLNPKPAKKKTARKTAKTIVVEIDLEKPMAAYDRRSDFSVGDQIDHSKFGHGIVAEVIDPDKMIVHFVSEGQKTMLRARP